jgi:hypothetical protein
MTERKEEKIEALNRYGFTDPEFQKAFFEMQEVFRNLDEIGKAKDFDGQAYFEGVSEFHNILMCMNNTDEMRCPNCH